MVVQLGNLNTALRAAQSGLWTTQQVLDVVANNVANVNTPGYSRKEAQLDPMSLAGAGTGVQMKGLSRTVDQGLLATLRRESGSLSAANVAATFEGRLQDVFGTPDSNSFDRSHPDQPADVDPVARRQSGRQPCGAGCGELGGKRRHQPQSDERDGAGASPGRRSAPRRRHRRGLHIARQYRRSQRQDRPRHRGRSRHDRPRRRTRPGRRSPRRAARRPRDDP